MSILQDHKAILKAYPNVIAVNDETGAIDKNKNSVFLDPALVRKARETLDFEKRINEYKFKRKEEYPEIGDQLDDLFKKGLFSDEMSAKIKAVKDKYPKS